MMRGSTAFVLLLPHRICDRRWLVGCRRTTKNSNNCSKPIGRDGKRWSSNSAPRDFCNCRRSSRAMIPHMPGRDTPEDRKGNDADLGRVQQRIAPKRSPGGQQTLAAQRPIGTARRSMPRRSNRPLSSRYQPISKSRHLGGSAPQRCGGIRRPGRRRRAWLFRFPNLIRTAPTESLPNCWPDK